MTRSINHVFYLIMLWGMEALLQYAAFNVMSLGFRVVVFFTYKHCINFHVLSMLSFLMIYRSETKKQMLFQRLEHSLWGDLSQEPARFAGSLWRFWGTHYCWYRHSYIHWAWLKDWENQRGKIVKNNMKYYPLKDITWNHIS